MTKSPNRRHAETIVLLRLFLIPKKGLSLADLKKSLSPLLGPALSSAEWTTFIDGLLADLRTVGLVSPTELSLTESGKQRMSELLGGTLPPRTLRWDQVKRRYLCPLALGLSPSSDEVRKSVADGDKMKALVLKELRHLPLGMTPTLQKAVDSLLWRELGLETDSPFTLEKVRIYLLQRLLPAVGRPASSKVLINHVLTMGTGATRADPTSLGDAVLRSWLSSGEAPKHAESVQSSIPLPDLAKTVLETARTVSIGKFGDNKVFISELWKAVAGTCPQVGSSLSEFKHFLVRAQEEQLLTLSRADLVEAMDPRMVEESETQYLNTFFHFVLVVD